MPTDIKTTHVSVDATIADRPIRIRGIHAANMAAAVVTFRIRDTTVAGTPLLSFDVPAGTAAWLTMEDFGFRAVTSAGGKPFADVATSASMTIFWD